MDKGKLENYIQTMDQLYYYKSARLFNEFYDLNLNILKEHKKDSIHHGNIRKYEVKSENPDFFRCIYYMKGIICEILDIQFIYGSEVNVLEMAKSRRITGVEKLDKVETEMRGIRFRDIIKNYLKFQPAHLISGQFNILADVPESDIKFYVNEKFDKDIVGPSILHFSYQKKKFDSKEFKKYKKEYLKK